MYKFDSDMVVIIKFIQVSFNNTIKIFFIFLKKLILTHYKSRYN
jgi:hypothetical protein